MVLVDHTLITYDLHQSSVVNVKNSIAESLFVGSLGPCVSDLEWLVGFIGGGFIVTSALLLLVHNNLQSHLWLAGLRNEPRSLTCEVSMVPLRQPNLARYNCAKW